VLASFHPRPEQICAFWERSVLWRIVSSSFSFWRCGCSASLTAGTPLIQEGSRPPPCPPRGELPPARRTASLPLSRPRAAATTPPTDPRTTYHACSTENFCPSAKKRLNWVKQVVTEQTNFSEWCSHQFTPSSQLLNPSPRMSTSLHRGGNNPLYKNVKKWGNLFWQ